MKIQLALITLIMACSSCALLLIAASGIDTVGFLYRDGNTYSGTVDLQQRNSGFGFGRDLQEFHDVVSMDVTNLNNFPVILYTSERPFVDRDSATYKTEILAPRDTIVGYKGVAIGLTCSVKNPRPMKLKCVVSGINHRIKSRRITAKSGWGVGP